VKAQEKLGWRLGMTAYSFHKYTLFEAIDKTNKLGLPYFGGLSFQKVSREIPKNFDGRLSDDELRQIRLKLDSAGIRLLTHYYARIPDDEEGCRRVFEFGRKMGIETFISEPPLEALDTIERFCDEYEINLAIHNHGEKQSPHYWHPDKILEVCEGRSDRVGTCADVGYWVRSGIDPVEGVRKLGSRLVTIQMHDLHECSSEGHDVPWGSGEVGVEKLLKELHRLGVRPTMFGLEYSYDWYDSMPEIAQSVEFFNDVSLQLKSEQAREALIQSITKQTLRRNRDGSAVTWFHPRACVIPAGNGQSTVLMTLQEIGGSDYFGPVHWSLSDDLGKTWSEPEPIAALGRDPVEGHPGLLAGVCDVTPQFHPQTGTVLALGHVVFYRGPRFSRGDQLARYPVYAVRRRDGSWSERKILKWDDPRGGHIYTNNCGQRVVMPNGDIMMSFTFGPEATNRMVAGVRCSFDGEELKVLEVGPPLDNKVGRGLLEPSLTKFRDRFYLTIRAEDGRGYVAVSDDGLNYRRKTAWAWDDGQPIAMSTTQQHWLTHSEGLFLVYTRKDASNTNVIRWRSPLWVARVDTERLCLVRSTEQTVLPLVGDGVKNPDEVALMGNFNVTNVSPHESWVTVGEWMPRRDAKGDLLLSRIRWSRPNSF
jgi:sugar phosphate isomerase/epimerase